MNKVSIYALICPYSFQPRYVGQTSQSLKARLKSHLSEEKNSAKCKWIRSLIGNVEYPGIIHLQETDSLHGNDIEKQWIERFRALGFTLYNKDVYQPRGIVDKNKVLITHDQFIDWKSKMRHGDARRIAASLNITDAKLKYIIDTRKGTTEEVEAIKKYFINKKAA